MNENKSKNERCRCKEWRGQLVRGSLNYNYNGATIRHLKQYTMLNTFIVHRIWRNNRIMHSYRLMSNHTMCTVRTLLRRYLNCRCCSLSLFGLLSLGGKHNSLYVWFVWSQRWRLIYLSFNLCAQNMLTPEYAQMKNKNKTPYFMCKTYKTTYVFYLVHFDSKYRWFLLSFSVWIYWLTVEKCSSTDCYQYEIVPVTWFFVHWTAVLHQRWVFRNYFTFSLLTDMSVNRMINQKKNLCGIKLTNFKDFWNFF